jgi:hypothetical protein
MSEMTESYMLSTTGHYVMAAQNWTCLQGCYGSVKRIVDWSKFLLLSPCALCQDTTMQATTRIRLLVEGQITARGCKTLIS